METKVFYYGDLLGLYIDNQLSKNVKTRLSRLMGYSYATSLRNFLFKNQSYIMDKNIMKAIDETLGFKNFSNAVDKYKNQLLKNRRENVKDIRINVEEFTGYYNINLFYTKSNICIS